MKQRESSVKKEFKQKEFPDRSRRENFEHCPATKITYEASPKRYISSAKVQSNLK